MSGVDKNVIIESGDNAWHEQNGTALLQTPILTKSLADDCRHGIPARYGRPQQYLVGQPSGNCNLHIMLVWR
ncbi:hypothetical protein AC244_16795 [Ensifer adhaerens]|uniref:Uncharacterized protein n=1 Tax=Ensifer adhaerens TaxID=106592 RepID=A0A0L8BT50_ENSAD|nr:hypothetical protein AC244_16795 [Ensifer adhaerens]